MNDKRDTNDLQTHCEWCGAEFDPDTSPPSPRTKAAAPPTVTQGEPATHCEWCGAEYPVPGEDQ